MNTSDAPLDLSEPAFDRFAQAIGFTIHGRPCAIPTDEGAIPTLDFTGLGRFSVDDLRSLDGWALTIEATEGDPTDEEDGFTARVRIADDRYAVTIWHLGILRTPIAEVRRI